MPCNTVFGCLIILLAARCLVKGVSIENEREQIINDCLHRTGTGWKWVCTDLSEDTGRGPGPQFASSPESKSPRIRKRRRRKIGPSESEERVSSNNARSVENRKPEESQPSGEEAADSENPSDGECQVTSNHPDAGVESNSETGKNPLQKFAKVSQETLKASGHPSKLYHSEGRGGGTPREGLNSQPGGNPSQNFSDKAVKMHADSEFSDTSASSALKMDAREPPTEVLSQLTSGDGQVGPSETNPSQNSWADSKWDASQKSWGGVAEVHSESGFSDTSATRPFRNTEVPEQPISGDERDVDLPEANPSKNFLDEVAKMPPEPEFLDTKKSADDGSFFSLAVVVLLLLVPLTACCCCLRWLNQLAEEHFTSPRVVRSLEEGTRPTSRETEYQDSLDSAIFDHLLASGGSQRLINALLFEETTITEFLGLKRRFFTVNGLTLEDFAAWRDVASKLKGVKRYRINRPKVSPHSGEGNIVNDDAIEEGVSRDLFKTDLRQDFDTPTSSTPTVTGTPVRLFSTKRSVWCD